MAIERGGSYFLTYHRWARPRAGRGVLPGVPRVPVRKARATIRPGASRATGSATTPPSSRERRGASPRRASRARADRGRARRARAGRLVSRTHPRAPVVEALDVDGVPVEIVRPPDDVPRPAWVFINGAHPLRRREPVVWRLARGSLGRDTSSASRTSRASATERSRHGPSSATEAVARAACDATGRPRWPRALIGASTGAGLALLAAGRPASLAALSVVAAVAPFADLRKLICLTTTGSYADEGGFARHEVTDLHRQVVARSLAAALPAGHDRERLLGELARIEEQQLDPLEELPRHGAGLAEDAQAVVACSANREPDRYDELYEALPRTVGRLRRRAVAAPRPRRDPGAHRDRRPPERRLLSARGGGRARELASERPADGDADAGPHPPDRVAHAPQRLRRVRSLRRPRTGSGRMTGDERSTTPAELPPAATKLMAPDRLGELTFDPPVISHGHHEPSGNRRFEGVYGGIYNRVIQSGKLRKAAFSIWGSADPLYELDSFVADAVRAARAASEAPVLVDLPTGGGTLLPFFAREGLVGTVVAVDLADAMLRRAVALQSVATPHLMTILAPGRRARPPAEDRGRRRRRQHQRSPRRPRPRGLRGRDRTDHETGRKALADHTRRRAGRAQQGDPQGGTSARNHTGRPADARGPAPAAR